MTVAIANLYCVSRAIALLCQRLLTDRFVTRFGSTKSRKTKPRSSSKIRPMSDTHTSDTRQSGSVSACCGSGVKRLKGVGMVCSACQEPTAFRNQNTDTEQVYFRYSCSENDGLITLVEPDSENLHHYDGRDCETLESIICWSVDTDTEQRGGSDD